ncbi:phosphoenolpyruvate--protein phosphotransferase [Gammaproteobacteria bacterium]|nr:phosphoenolpyruvate--protein phosphotransferase [Gammaproteobacteria bacterium]
MLSLHGAGIGKGIAIGRAIVLKRSGVEIPQFTIQEAEIQTEVERFQKAIDDTHTQLLEIGLQIPADAPPESKSFIEVYMLMLNDPLIAHQPTQTIRTERCNAEWALQIHSESLVDTFDRMQDEYLREKKNDVRHITTRIQHNLLNIPVQGIHDIPDQLVDKIVISHELSPADTVQFKNMNILAFVTDLGGPISHTAILARSLNIPAVVGLHGAIKYIKQDEMVIVDGKRGTIVVGPDQGVLDKYKDRQDYVVRRRRELNDLKNKQPVTRDGQAITLLANVELPEDIRAARRASAQGVGLYRTEYLFMNRPDPPTEQEQYAAYSEVVQRMKSPVTIRTLDLGADKQVDGGRSEAPTNPALGLRAVRLCLHEPALFRPQLRAVLRASALGPIQIMIPMVSNLNELDQVFDMIAETKEELQENGEDFDGAIPIGGMIEVPAAAIAADLFAQKLDFLSIGTNDLIQYTLAIDRIDDAVNYLYDPLHPSVLRLIKLTIDAGARARVPVTMCGEMAGDARYTKLLLGLGLKIFSMDPTSILEVKKKILETDLPVLAGKIDEIMECGDSNTIRDMVVALEKPG